MIWGSSCNNLIILPIVMSEQEDGFIGSKLKLIPSSRLIYSTPQQLLLLAKRQIIRLDTVQQTLVYAPIDDQKIVHATYHSLLSVYLLLTQKHILAVNESGEVIKRMYIQSLQGLKFIFMVGLQDGYKGVPNYRQDLLIYVKGDHLYSAKTTVFNERQMIKTKSICDISLTPQPPTLLQSPQFIQKQKHLAQCSLLILWDNNQTYIYKTPTLLGQNIERLYIYNKISKRENQSLDYAVSMPNKLMAVAFQSGVVKVFYLDHSKKYLADLKGHQAACTTLFVGSKNSHLLYSSGLDSTVRIWNLRDYEQVYMLQLDILTRQCVFIDERLLFMRSEELKQKSYLCQLNTNLLQPVVNDNVSGHLLKMRSNSEWCISIYSNNLVEFFSVSNHALSNQKLEYPLQYGAVVDVFSLGKGTYVVTFQKGFSLIQFNKQEIKAQNFQLKKLVYNESIVRKKEDNDNFIELIHEKLLGTFIFNVISDWKNIPTAIKVTYVYFHRNRHLPLWDGHNYKKKESGNEVTYCVIGTAKGEIMFVDIQNRSHYSTRVHFHTESVEFVRQIVLDRAKSNPVFVSMSSDKQIVIWQLSHKEHPTALVNFSHNKQITYFEAFDNYLVVGEKDGQFSILKIGVSSQGQVRSYKANSLGGHLRAVICGDYMKYHQSDLFLSGGQDSVIKVWRGVQKTLIFQLKLFGIISTINFLHDRLNLIVCHNQQISIIKQEKLKSLKKAEKMLSDSGMTFNNQSLIEQINLRTFFYKEPLSPMSPFRRNPHLLRSNTKYFHLQRKPTKIEDIQYTLLTTQKEPLEQVNRTVMTKPASEPRFQSTDKKIKRFHIYTNDRYADSGSKPAEDIMKMDIVLPRINTKGTIGNKNRPKLDQSNDFLTRREYKVKSFSSAFKNRF